MTGLPQLPASEPVRQGEGTGLLYSALPTVGRYPDRQHDGGGNRLSGSGGGWAVWGMVARRAGVPGWTEHPLANPEGSTMRRLTSVGALLEPPY